MERVMLRGYGFIQMSLGGVGGGGPCTDQNKFNMQQFHPSPYSVHCVSGTHDKRAAAVPVTRPYMLLGHAVHL